MLTNQWKSLNLAMWDLVFRVMDEKSITRVADSCEIQRSQLSRLISSLEAETGQKLFERQSRRLMPTQTALVLRKKIEPLLEKLHGALDELEYQKDYQKGSIRFGAMPGFLQTQVVPLIAEFQKMHPNVTFDVIGDDDPKAFMQGQSDLMLYYGPVGNHHIEEHWVTKSLFIPCASPKYLEEAGIPMEPSDLAFHAGVIYTGRVRPHSDVLEKNGRHKSFNFKSRIRFNNILLAKTAAMEGCGVVLDMPLHHCFEEIMEGKLVPILNGWQIPNLDNYIGATHEASKLKRVRTFVDWYIRKRREIEGNQKLKLQERFPFIV